MSNLFLEKALIIENQLYKKVKDNDSLKKILLVRPLVAHLFTDSYVFSFPKSGRTWLRMLFAYYFSFVYKVDLTPEVVDQWRQNIRVPRVRFTHLGSDIIDITQKGMFLRDGCPSMTSFEKYNKKKVILLYRDPRDVVVSYYYHVTRRWESYPPEVEAIGSFIRDNRLGIPRIVGFMNDIVDKLETINNFTTVSYEDMHHDALACLDRLFKFIGVVNIIQDAMKKALDECAFSKLKKIEEKGMIKDHSLKPVNLKDKMSYKVREGKVGGYKAHLSKKDIDYVDSFINNNLDSYFKAYL